MDIAANLAAVRDAIAGACERAGRRSDAVRLIAVTKAQGPEVLAPLAAAGVLDVGENRLEHHGMMRTAAPPGMRFHAIGRLQGRQLAGLAALSDCVHGLCEPGHIRRLGRACAALGRRLPVYLQVNTSGEASKAGLAAGALPAALAAAREEPQLEVVGLMTMAPEREEGADEMAIRRCFAACRDLAERHGLRRLSMGMSQDFAWAIAEGATEVRIGTRLFAP